MDQLIENLPLLSKVASTLVMILLVIGLVYRRHTRIHIPIMLSCFALDLSNVLVIELNRGAIRQTMDTVTEVGDWLLKFHIVVSVICVICYPLAVFTGLRLLRRGVHRTSHRLNACVFLVTRVLNYVTSFWVGV